MVSTTEFAPVDADEAVDAVITACLNPDAPQSFFLYAGAGSGKTHSLVEALKVFAEVHGSRFRSAGKRIGIITYTNAARDEIDERVDEDPLFHIRTIHSFCWEHIGTLHHDIRLWLLNTLPLRIRELEGEEARGRAGTKASIARQRSIASKRRRLEWLSLPREFTYSPTGENTGRASLSHSEVLRITATFLTQKPSMQQLLINRFPFLLIDESQDTNKALIEALCILERERQGQFALGLIGDMMQRIYGDGKPDLGVSVPEGWATPSKTLNRRCPTRIVALANDIRADADGQVQRAVNGTEQGHVHLFIAPADTSDKADLEATIRSKMAQLTADPEWTVSSGVKTLALEHRMSAMRMGFSELLTPLLGNDRFSTSVLDGSLGAVNVFSTAVWPLLNAALASDAYSVMNLLRLKKSLLLDKSVLLNPAHTGDPLAPVREAVAALVTLVEVKPHATFLDVLDCISQHSLFPIPRDLEPFVTADEDVEIASPEASVDRDSDADPSDSDSTIESLAAFLEAPFMQIEHYIDYIGDTGAFDTHQGVKGREFDRVLVVMDDADARGFLFSYEKLFAVSPQTANDARRQAAGEDTSEDRTRRLFYVTCTRAEKSLALVGYTADKAKLASTALAKGWFEANEITVL